MTKTWDQAMRTLVRTSPQAFVNLVLPGTRFIKKQPEKLKNWQLEVDALLNVVAGEQEMLLHLEFQTYNDAKMAERLLRYNVLARSEYDLPVLSCVIYLLKDGMIQTSPLNWSVPTEQPVLQFHFENIQIGELAPEEILRTSQPGLLPFLPLTRGGASREVVQLMFEALAASKDKELELVGFTLASLVLKRSNPLDWEWLQRKFKVMHDIIQESPIYQLILNEGLEQGLKQGQQALRQALRQMVVDIVQAHFVGLVHLAQQQVRECGDVEALKRLGVEVSIARDEQTVEQLLLNLSQKSK